MRGSIDPSWLELKHFQKDLRYALAHPDAPVLDHGDRLTPFGDTIEELEHWSCFQPRNESDDLDADLPWTPSDLPARNPFRHVGRNDPCPCGSGKKFKKCCLGLDPDALIERMKHPPRSVATMQGLARYDPLVPPDPEQWQGLDEQTQIDLIRDYHRHAGIRVPRAEAHAIFHVVVERQIALGDQTPVRRTVQRLISEGLDRHEAIHAVGSVLAEHMNDLVSGPDPKPREDADTEYYAAVERLTAQEWLRTG